MGANLIPNISLNHIRVAQDARVMIGIMSGNCALIAMVTSRSSSVVVGGSMPMASSTSTR